MFRPERADDPPELPQGPGQAQLQQAIGRLTGRPGERGAEIVVLHLQPPDPDGLFGPSRVDKFGLGNADKVPSVILTDAEHKAVTAELRVDTAGVEDVKQLWAAYQRAYAKHPAHWLEAIKPYFVKGP